MLMYAYKTKGGKMKSIIVTPAENGKFKVLVNYIQHGIEYSSKVQAEKEAEILRQKFGIKPTVSE